MIYRGPGALTVVCLAHRPPPPLSKARPATQRKTEKERQPADGRRGTAVGGGAKSYDSKKACSSRNPSVLSVPCICIILSNARVLLYRNPPVHSPGNPLTVIL